LTESCYHIVNFVSIVNVFTQARKAEADPVNKLLNLQGATAQESLRTTGYVNVRNCIMTKTMLS